MAKLKTIAVYGEDGQRVIINVSDLAEYEAQGYKLAESAGTPPADDKNSVNFDRYNDDQINEFAVEAGVPGTVKKRETIIKKLKESGFVPPVDDDE